MPSETEIYGALTEIFHDVFMRDDITLTPETSARDIKGWDSFKRIEIILGVEDRFGIKLNTRELDSLRNVGDLAAVVANKAA